MNRSDFKRMDFPTHKYIHMAMKYYHAATVLLKEEREFGSHPLYYLYCHASELCMKGFLRAKGISSVKLKRKAHNLENLYSNCIKRGLSIPERNLETDRKLVENLNRYYQNKQFEYMELGAMVLPKLSEVSEFAKGLLKVCASTEISSSSESEDKLVTQKKQKSTVASSEGNELRDTIAGLTSVVEVGLFEYQVEWGRISSMQQSAGILIAGLAIVVSTLFAFVNSMMTSSTPTNFTFFNHIVYPTVAVALAFVALTMLYFFRVIWPRVVRGLPHPKSLRLQLKHPQLWQNLAVIIDRTDGAVSNIHSYVEQRQLYFLIALRFFAASAIFTAISSIMMMSNAICLEMYKFYYWSILALVTIVYTVLSLSRRKVNNGNG